MSTKTLVIVIIGAALLALLIGGYIGWTLKPVKVCPVITDSSYVIGIPYLVPYPVTVIKWEKKQPAIKTNSGYVAVFDSEFVSHKDTIGIKSLVSFNDSTKNFSMDMDIEHKDYESFRIDSVKYTVIETKEVEVDNPLWIWTTVAGGILLILSIIFGG